ncbi:hypothetical protein ACFQ71_40820, partial [Streptomyces sp. NPDC056534]
KILTEPFQLLLGRGGATSSADDRPDRRDRAQPHWLRSWPLHPKGPATGCKRPVAEHSPAQGIDVGIVHRAPATKGFVVQARRWAIGRTLSRLMEHRRTALDCEALPARSEAMIHVAMTSLMTRRPTAKNTPTW